jgi:hypothetical protein
LKIKVFFQKKVCKIKKRNLSLHKQTIRMHKTNDLLWKGIIEDCFEDFAYLMLPTLAPLIDFNRGIDFLDKELEDLFSLEEKKKLRVVDKLAKFYTLNGEEHYILAHIEVQGYYDLHFAKRMYIYFVRLKEKHDKPICALAIFTDGNKNFKPDIYEEIYHGTEIRYKYLTYKVLDQDLIALQASENPFAIVIETVLVALQNKKLADNDLLKLKIDLVKRLLRKKISKEKIASMMNFIRYYLRFKQVETNIAFEQEIEIINQKSYPMGTHEILLHQAETKGIKKGEKRGIEKGIEKQRENSNISFTTSLIVSTDFDDVKIATLVGVSTEYVANLRNELKK